jgi:UDP-N-acetylmuramyl pentapeptide phosphotransferase/UDP-N-acetylglucosamine-1-phosphate transferase
LHFPWVAALAAAPISALVLVILHLAHRRLPQDQPNARSLHRHPVPRVGGIAIWAGFLPSALLASGADASWRAWAGAWLAIVAVSLIDDWRGVRPELRLAVQAAAATAVTAELLGSRFTQGFGPAAAALGLAVILALMWAANLYNFMDGSDGLAAVMTICGFAAYAAAASISGRAPQLYFALPRGGSLFSRSTCRRHERSWETSGRFLRILAGAFGWRVVDNAWPAWFPLLVFLPFIADATLTLLRRLARRERVFEAHRAHYYQRLHRMGAGHRGTLVFYAVLIVGTTTSAVFTLAQGRAAGWAVLTGWAVAIGVAFAGIDYHWRNAPP